MAVSAEEVGDLSSIKNQYSNGFSRSSLFVSSHGPLEMYSRMAFAYFGVRSACFSKARIMFSSNHVVVKTMLLLINSCSRFYVSGWLLLPAKNMSFDPLSLPFLIICSDASISKWSKHKTMSSLTMAKSGNEVNSDCSFIKA